jgi:hypothetical protein
LIDSLPN